MSKRRLGKVEWVYFISANIPCFYKFLLLIRHFRICFHIVNWSGHRY